MITFIRNLIDAVSYSELAMTLRYGNNRGYSGNALNGIQSVVSVLGVVSVAGMFIIF